MLDTFNFPTPQQSNYQEFYGGGDTTGALPTRDWVKPRGASMVRFMLIGAGGGGSNGSSTVGGGGGGSGGITSWIGPAIFIPDVLQVAVGVGRVAADGIASAIFYRASNGDNQLLTASGGSAGSGTTGGAGGTAIANNYFGASGIYTSIAGQAGTAGSSTGAGTNQAASATTFLSGGAGGAGATANTGGSVTPNYGYTALSTTAAGGTTAAKDGYFITQPILVGCGGAGGTTSGSVGTGGGRGGIGCGGGGSEIGRAHV
jgi:hypothetical protein